MRLENKVAVITGAASGIGSGIAHRFAEEGARLVLSDINGSALKTLQAELEDVGASVAVVEADVTDREAVRELFRTATSSFETVDILVNSAGTCTVGTVADTTEEDWQKNIEVNLRSVYLACQQAAEIMLPRQRGSIVNIASVVSLVGWTRRVAYAASKGGVFAMTRSMAVDFAGEGIRVNAIAPGAIDTPLAAAIAKADPGVGGNRVNKTPRGRLGRPDDIAHGALYLASDESDFVTGHTLVIDGGYSAQ